MKKLVVLMQILSLINFVSCTNSCVSKNKKDIQIAAIVNNEKITLNELDLLHTRAMKIIKKSQPINEKISNDIRASLLKKLIDNEILKQESVKQNTEIDRFERVELLKDYKKRLGGNKAFQYFLEQKKLTEEQIIETILAEKRKEKLIEKLGEKIEPTQEEIVAYYNQNQKLFGLPQMVKVSHILLKLSVQDPKEKEKLVFDKANQILKEALEKKDSFEVLVDKYSEGPSVKNKGDLGYFAKGKMVKVFEDACFLNPVGSIVGPIKTEFGYHIIHITDKLEERIGKLEEVNISVIKELKKQKLAQASEKLLNSLRRQASLEIKDKSLTVDNFYVAHNEESEMDLLD
jgi:peptidyl-prolyl cis-trans isomerase C